MAWRELGRGGEYPGWLRALRGRSGVYLIRERSWFGLGAWAVVYVGESHTGRLYQTLTRHFQQWSGPTAGPTYVRGDVEVRVIPLAADRAVAAQDRLIRRLRPRDNTLGKAPELEEAPF